MGFLIENFSPVGGNARGGNAPLPGNPSSENSIQVFSYTSQDDITAIQVPGYFNELGGGRYVRRGDWIDIASNVDASIGQSLNFFLGDGTIPSVLTATLLFGGTSGYTVGNRLEITFTDGTITQKATLQVTAAAGGVASAIKILDPGFFTVVPTSLTGLSTVAITGGGDDTLTVTLTLATTPGAGLVTLVSEIILAS